MGAFTGEISAEMLYNIGARYVILGHSERRQLFGENDDFIHRKVVRALQDDLQPVLCVGETIQQREAGQTEEVLQHQINIAMQGVPDQDAVRIILAYEPVWAISAGKTATPKIAADAHVFCRRCLEKIFGKKIAGQISILYGGSVKSDNVKEIVEQKEIDGVLVGGASLDPTTFAAIIQNCEGIQ